MKFNSPREWFGPEKSGVGISPRSWEGWTILAIFVAVMITGAFVTA